MNMNLLADGLVLLLLGMGMVIVFLSLMVGLMTLSARILSRFSHLLPAETPSSGPRASSADDDAALVAVLTAAVRRYRQDH